MDKASVYKRKTIGLIAKNLIILVVLLTVTVLSIWAWFTQYREDHASGVYAQAVADGVEMSWDAKDYYKDLTAASESLVTAKNGPRKYIADSQYSSLKLITGNGIDFFEPYLNRRTATVFKRNNIWQGSIIKNDKGENKFIDIDIYFRSLIPKSIYLAGDSRVLPNDASEYGVRQSDYGAFSKDYICSAARVAFLDSEKKNCKYIWAPNSDYSLIEDEDGYKKYTTTDNDITTSTGGYGGNLNGGAVYDGNKYYLWTFNDELIDTYQKAQNSSYLAPREFKYDSNIKYYVAELSIWVPTYETNNPSIPLIISNSSIRSDLSNGDNLNINGNNSQSISHKDQNFYIVGGDFKLDENTSQEITATNKMYPNSAYIKSGEHITITLGYNPATDILTVLKYDATGGDSFDIGLGQKPVTTTVIYYPIESGSRCTLVNPKSSLAISTGNDDKKKEVLFKDNSTKLNVLQLSVSNSEQFTVLHTNGSKSRATYKFRDNKLGKYLTISNASVTFTTTGTHFYLTYIEGVQGPALKSGDYYVVFKDNELTAVHKSVLNTGDLVTVYTGNTYLMKTGQPDYNDYYYYDATTNKLKDLNSYSSPPLYATSSTEKARNIVGKDKAIVTLTKENTTDEYYTAHVVMRVWVEGTDRDAKTPLAGGKFNLKLHFTTVLPK